MTTNSEASLAGGSVSPDSAFECALFSQTTLRVARVELPSGRFQRANPRCADWLGDLSPSSPERTLEQAVHPDDAAVVRALLAGEAAQTLLRLQLRHGAFEAAAVTLHRLTADGARPAAALLVCEPRYQTCADERLFHTLVEQIADGFELIDEDGRLLAVNQATCTMLGYSREQLLTMSVADIDPTLELDAYRTGFARLREQPEATFESTHRRADGSEFAVEIRARVVEIEGRQRILACVCDVAARRAPDEALRASVARFEAFMANLPAAAFIKTADGRTVFVNHYLEDLLGMHQWRDRLTTELIAGDVGERMAADDLLALRSGPLEVEESMVDTLGVERTFRTVKFPITVADGPVLLGGVSVDITDRIRAEAALHSSEERLRVIATHTPDHIFVQDQDLRYTFIVNPPLGLPAEAILGQLDSDFLTPDDAARLTAVKRELLASGQPYHLETPLANAAGDVEYFAGTYVPKRNQDGEVDGLIGYFRNVTERVRADAERERLREQLAQAQKLESVGRLAGGVAHDFNNMLQVILGNAALAADAVMPDGPVAGYLQEIRLSAERSAELTRQLLAFARRQMIVPKVIDLNDTVASTLNMLARLIGENIELVWRPDADIRPVELDPNQVSQVLINLCVNARDAIDGDGRIELATRNVQLTGEQADLPAGDYVMLAVTDTGSGMSETTRQHLFEPFYTTKDVGRGTGLGLATVFGIVKQNGGGIEVESDLGRGSSLRLYLPCANRAADTEPAPDVRRRPDAVGHHTVLLVEDEQQILSLARRILEHEGYRVLAALSPSEALVAADGHDGPIHLLVTDVVMPGMDGVQLRAMLARTRPELRCLYISGHDAELLSHRGVGDDDFLRKPFSLDALADRVRTILGRR
ncbi:MAG: PAS domain S-box protein [Armatimonadetes bacterium]|nr:PAS domain S-box protein [Armatimonadota bacterium]